MLSLEHKDCPLPYTTAEWEVKCILWFSQIFPRWFKCCFSPLLSPPLAIITTFPGFCCFSETPDNLTMAPHSSTLAWEIPWTAEPGRLQSMGSRRVGPDWATSLSLFTFMHWRRKWQPTPVFLPGESQGRRSLVGCRLWGCTESDMTDVT